MSSLRVEIVAVDAVKPHPNADRLEIATVAGWECIVGKNQFKAGDPAVYIPIDAVLPDTLETRIFEGAKIKLKHGRVRTIKLRGTISQGLLVDFSKLPLMKSSAPGTDVAELLGITKYEPPQAEQMPVGPPGVKKKKPGANPGFRKYTELENVKWHPNLFTEGEEVVFTEKVHGTNFRFGYLKNDANTWWKRVLKFFGRLPEWQFCYGSHNMQLQDGSYRGGWYARTCGNVYEEAVCKYDLPTLLTASHDYRGFTFYGEIYGAGIQKHYRYGCGPDERRLVVFDIQADNGAWLDPATVAAICGNLGLACAPVLYRGPYTKEAVAKHLSGPSVLAPEQTVREGFVARPVAERVDSHFGRVVLKYINPDYLLGDQSDGH